MKRLALLSLFAVALSAFGQKFTATSMPNPASDASLQPNWSVGPDGSAILSWLEPQNDRYYVLRYAVWKGGSWSAARTVAEKRQFFRHPAELPEVIALSDKQWLAHWVEMPNEETEAEFVYVSSSTDGIHWTAPIVAHRDKSQVEHGLASMVVSGNAEASILWLEMLKGEDGPASLKRTVVSAAGKVIKEEALDTDVCTCCPTAVAKTTKGFVVAYRDHTSADIRDIAVTRFEGGKWTPAKIVSADNWKINACPINAASVAAKGDHLALAWYTGAQGSPKVQVVFSEDGGATFTKPVVVSTGHAFGYSSVILEEDGSAIVSWLQDKADGGTLVLARAVKASGAMGDVLQVAEGGKAAQGYPRLFHAGNDTFITWGNAKPKVQTARLQK